MNFQRLTLLLMTLHALTLCIFKSKIMSCVSQDTLRASKVSCLPAATQKIDIQRWSYSCCQFKTVAPILIFVRQKLFHWVLHVKVLQLFLIDWVYHTCRDKISQSSRRHSGRHSARQSGRQSGRHSQTHVVTRSHRAVGNTVEDTVGDIVGDKGEDKVGDKTRSMS